MGLGFSWGLSFGFLTRISSWYFLQCFYYFSRIFIFLTYMSSSRCTYPDKKCFCQGWSVTGLSKEKLSEKLEGSTLPRNLKVFVLGLIQSLSSFSSWSLTNGWSHHEGVCTLRGSSSLVYTESFHALALLLGSAGHTPTHAPCNCGRCESPLHCQRTYGPDIYMDFIWRQRLGPGWREG